MMLAVPVDPDAEEARDWVLRELSEPGYRAAEPNWLDRAAAAVRDWFASVFDDGNGPPPLVVIVVIVALVLAAFVVAYVVFGPPRANRRRVVPGGVFGDDDGRDAAALRRAAAAAASTSDWALAVEEMFRAVARSLEERAVLTTSPGTTATGFATRAAVHFPDSTADLQRAAARFDAVRYLGENGTQADWEHVDRVERVIRESRPRFEVDLDARFDAAGTA